MNRVEQNTITLNYDQDGWSLPLQMEFLMTANWVGAQASHFHHVGAEVAFNRVFLFRHGGCRIRWGERRERLTSGRIYLLPIGSPFEVDYTAGVEIFAFHFHLSTSSGRDVFRFCDRIQCLNAPGLFEEIVAGVDAYDLQGTLRWQSALFQAACRLAAPVMGEVFEQEKQARDLKELLEYIQAAPMPGLRLGPLARRMKTTRAALSKRFERVMGVPLKTFLIQATMRRALGLVVCRDLTVQQIAYQLGYKDPLYFHRVFKKHMGMTPMEYRQKATLEG